VWTGSPSAGPGQNYPASLGTRSSSSAILTDKGSRQRVEGEQANLEDVPIDPTGKGLQHSRHTLLSSPSHIVAFRLHWARKGIGVIQGPTAYETHAASSTLVSRRNYYRLFHHQTFNTRRFFRDRFCAVLLGILFR